MTHKSNGIFEDLFEAEALKGIFREYLSTSFATGIDHLTPLDIVKDIDNQLEIIERKSEQQRYKFTRFKLKLISKGAGKAPREISIPTIRDRIVLKALNKCLSQIYDDEVSFEIPQAIISRVKDEINNGGFGYHIKLDVANFYPSLRHDTLLQKLRDDRIDPRVISLVQSAIETPTTSISSKDGALVDKGVAQGLSISNFLAALYMVDIDSQFSQSPDFAYFRYVDDILILCKTEDYKEITNQVISSANRVGLQVYDPETAPEKSSHGKVEARISYLGYEFLGSLISVREQTLFKLKSSIAAIFTAYKHSKNSNVEFLLWRLDLRVTGCIYQNKQKGWLFFFAEINDEKLLHKLDDYIEKLKKRFGVNEKPKRFVRAFYEIKHHKYSSNYIPNFDTYTRSQKIELLKKYFPSDVKGKKLTDSQIDFHFSRRIARQTKDLLEDVKDFKY